MVASLVMEETLVESSLFLLFCVFLDFRTHFSREKKLSIASFLSAERKKKSVVYIKLAEEKKSEKGREYFYLF